MHRRPPGRVRPRAAPRVLHVATFVVGGRGSTDHRRAGVASVWGRDRIPVPRRQCRCSSAGVDGSGTSINDRCLRPPGAGVVRLIHTFLAFPWGRHGSDRSCRELCRDSTSPPNQLDTEWVGLFRETQADGRVRYGVEHLDQRFNEICPDDLFSTENEAEARAQDEYALRPEDWREGQARDPDWNERAGAASRLKP